MLTCALHSGKEFTRATFLQPVLLLHVWYHPCSDHNTFQRLGWKDSTFSLASQTHGPSRIKQPQCTPWSQPVDSWSLKSQDHKLGTRAHEHTSSSQQFGMPVVSKRTAGLAALFLKYLWALVASIDGNLFILGPWAIHISIVGVHFQLRHPSLELRKDYLAQVLAVFVLPGFHHLQGRFRPSWAETHPRSFNDLWKGRPEINWWKVYWESSDLDDEWSLCTEKTRGFKLTADYE